MLFLELSLTKVSMPVERRKDPFKVEKLPKMMVEDEGSQVAFNLILGGGQSPLSLKPENGKSLPGKRPDIDDGEVTKGRETGKDDLSIVVLFGELDVY